MSSSAGRLIHRRAPFREVDKDRAVVHVSEALRPREARAVRRTVRPSRARVRRTIHRFKLGLLFSAHHVLTSRTGGGPAPPMFHTTISGERFTAAIHRWPSFDGANCEC
ncbi:hypothetical protein J4Q44_G00170460 [Coregonus suidteri]|uniref:Uncharacterized protein n=1 Tax=Coregonus suidteri TaxID=861788 RepID=A0AAN8LMV1_9TELE